MPLQAVSTEYLEIIWRMFSSNEVLCENSHKKTFIFEVVCYHSKFSDMFITTQNLYEKKNQRMIIKMPDF